MRPSMVNLSYRAIMPQDGLSRNIALHSFTRFSANKRVESRTGAVALVFRWRIPRLSPALSQSGLAWLCFLFPLIEPNRRVSRIRLSEKVSRGRPRKADRPPTKADQPKLLMQGDFRILFGRRPSYLVLGTQPLP